MSGESFNFISYVDAEILGRGVVPPPLPTPPSCFRYNEKQAARRVKTYGNTLMKILYLKGYMWLLYQKQRVKNDFCGCRR